MPQLLIQIISATVLFTRLEVNYYINGYFSKMSGY